MIRTVSLLQFYSLFCFLHEHQSTTFNSEFPMVNFFSAFPPHTEELFFFLAENVGFEKLGTGSERSVFHPSRAETVCEKFPETGRFAGVLPLLSATFQCAFSRAMSLCWCWCVGGWTWKLSDVDARQNLFMKSSGNLCANVTLAHKQHDRQAPARLYYAWNVIFILNEISYS